MTTKEIIHEAERKGYYVDKDGNVFSKRKQRSLGKTKERYTFGIQFNNKQYTISVHKFVAYFKYGDATFEPGIETRHFNGNSLDNTWDNILIGTHSDNMLDMSEDKRIKLAIKRSIHTRRFSDDEVQSILKDRQSGMCYRLIAEKHNTCKGSIGYIINKAYYSGARTI